MIYLNAKLVILSIFIIAFIYLVIGNIVYGYLLMKRRGKDYSLNLKMLFGFALLGCSFFIVAYFDLFSGWFCFLYVIGFLILLSIMIYYRKDTKENRINNMAFVIDKVKDNRRLNIKDFLIPNYTFNAKLLLRYGPKKTIKIMFVSSLILIGIYLYLFATYFEYVNIVYILVWLSSFSIFFLLQYKRMKKEYKMAINRVKDGSYKEDYELF